MNSPTLYLFSCESFMADKMGLCSTTLHYLAIWQAMVSLLRERTFENHPNLSLTAFKALINTKVALS